MTDTEDQRLLDDSQVSGSAAGSSLPAISRGGVEVRSEGLLARGVLLSEGYRLKRQLPRLLDGAERALRACRDPEEQPDSNFEHYRWAYFASWPTDLDTRMLEECGDPRPGFEWTPFEGIAGQYVEDLYWIEPENESQTEFLNDFEYRTWMPEDDAGEVFCFAPCSDEGRYYWLSGPGFSSWQEMIAAGAREFGWTKCRIRTPAMIIGQYHQQLRVKVDPPEVSLWLQYTANVPMSSRARVRSQLLGLPAPPTPGRVSIELAEAWEPDVFCLGWFLASRRDSAAPTLKACLRGHELTQVDDVSLWCQAIIRYFVESERAFSVSGRVT